MRLPILGLALASCVDPPWVPPTIESARVERIDIPLLQKPAVDLLFVVDTSPATRAHAANLAHNWPGFVDVLDTLTGGRPSLHLGVTTSDPLDDGAFHGPTGGDTYMIDEAGPDGTRLNNYDGPLRDAFAAAATIDEVSAISRPLEMARRALLRHPGFVRDRAYLAIVIITAQDDQSPQPLHELVAFFGKAKPARERFIVAAAMGPRAMPCEYDGATAAATPRLAAFLDAFPGRSTFTTLCQQDLSGVMQQLSWWRPIIGNPCFERSVREDSCEAWMGFSDGRPDASLARCGDQVGTCFAIEEAPEDCPGGPQQRVWFAHPPEADRLTVECEVDQVTEIPQP